MEANQFKGRWALFTGGMKQRWNRLTDDDALKIEEKIIKCVGIAQKQYSERKRELMKWAGHWRR